MSVIVDGIDMPKNCLDCEFFYEDYDHHDAFSSFCRLLKDGVYNEHMIIDGFGRNERYRGCPVAPKDSVIDDVLEIIDTAQTYKMFEGEEDTYLDKRVIREAVEALIGGGAE